MLVRIYSSDTPIHIREIICRFGIVKEITVEDGQPVEFGQTIAILS